MPREPGGRVISVVKQTGAVKTWTDGKQPIPSNIKQIKPLKYSEYTQKRNLPWFWYAKNEVDIMDPIGYQIIEASRTIFFWKAERMLLYKKKYKPKVPNQMLASRVDLQFYVYWGMNFTKRYTAAISFSPIASYYAYQCYLGLIRNIDVQLMGYPVHTNMFKQQDSHKMAMQKKIAVRSGLTLPCNASCFNAEDLHSAKKF